MGNCTLSVFYSCRCSAYELCRQGLCVDHTYLAVYRSNLSQFNIKTHKLWVCWQKISSFFFEERKIEWVPIWDHSSICDESTMVTVSVYQDNFSTVLNTVRLFLINSNAISNLYRR